MAEVGYFAMFFADKLHDLTVCVTEGNRLGACKKCGTLNKEKIGGFIRPCYHQ